MKALRWYASIVTVVVILFGICLFYRNLLPIPDRGHRAYGVNGAREARILENILTPYLGRPSMRFDAGPTHQVLFPDRTVINWLNPDFVEKHGVSPSAISLVAKDPSRAADSLAHLLADSGYVASWFDIADYSMPGESFPRNKLVILKCNAFHDPIVFRRHIFKMPRPETQ